MDLISILAAANGDADFAVGLLVGVCLGFLVGPVFRSWQIYREWADASREARLADSLLAKMELGPDRSDRSDDGVPRRRSVRTP